MSDWSSDVCSADLPTSADVLRKNPLGIYVDAIDWSREFETAPSPAPQEHEAGERTADMPFGSPVDTNPGAQPSTIQESNPCNILCSRSLKECSLQVGRARWWGRGGDQALMKGGD